MNRGCKAALGAMLVLVCQTALAQDAQETPEQQPPVDMPSLEEVAQEGSRIPDYVPLDVDFRIGVVGDFTKELVLETGTQKQIKSPLILIDPRTGQPGVYAKNFPARIVANSQNGAWVIGVAPSTAVEGSSGSRTKECAVSLKLTDGSIKMIEEFPLHSSFQALFAPNDNNLIYYCVNEPGAENIIYRYHLNDQTKEAVPAEGNRFYLYGLLWEDPRAIWASDPLYTPDCPLLDLIALQTGEVLQSVPFPGATEILARPNGQTLLAIVSSSAEASLGFYDVSQRSFNQVPGLVLTRPIVRWAHNSFAVIAKESTATRDRFLWVDLATGEARELFSGYFKVSYWDISPNDDALVFMTGSSESPVLFVVPLTPDQTTVNRIPLLDVTNVSWIGCLNPPSSDGWLERLLPF